MANGNMSNLLPLTTGDKKPHAYGHRKLKAKMLLCKPGTEQEFRLSFRGIKRSIKPISVKDVRYCRFDDFPISVIIIILKVSVQKELFPLLLDERSFS